MNLVVLRDLLNKVQEGGPHESHLVSSSSSSSSSSFSQVILPKIETADHQLCVRSFPLLPCKMEDGYLLSSLSAFLGIRF